jgi:glycosyltransferase involved in cell wall biosynthesis
MHVLSLSTDAEILRPHSPVAARMAAYAERIDALHIILYTKSVDDGPSCVTLSPKLFVYPTRTPARLTYFRVAYNRAIEILHTAPNKTWVLTTQDPFETGIVGAWIHRKYRLPWQVQVHTDFLSSAFTTTWLQWLRARIGMAIVQKADMVRVVSERIRQSLIAVAPQLKDRMIVLPIFVDTLAIARATSVVDVHAIYSGRSPIILMASRITKEKQIALAIDAVKQFAVSHPHVLLLIVGEGSEKATLEKYVQQVGAPVIFVPWVDTVFAQYKSADLFLNTSAFEGYGRTLIEAHAALLPIVSTDVGVAREVIATPGDGVVADGTIAGIVPALTTVTANSAKGIRPQPITEHQSFDAYIKAFVEAWHTTLQRKKN